MQMNLEKGNNKPLVEGRRGKRMTFLFCLFVCEMERKDRTKENFFDMWTEGKDRTRGNLFNIWMDDERCINQTKRKSDKIGIDLLLIILMKQLSFNLFII